MATYQKRGYKKTDDTEVSVENTTNGEHSTTAEVFDTLDETANISEKWIEKNNKPLFIGLIVAVLAIFGYMGYTQYVVEPNEKEAANALVFAKQNFTKANDISNADLYKAALEGGEGNYGLVDIAANYKNTEAGNLAKYYAGISYINLKEYDDAISYLKNVSTKDPLLNAVVAGSIGDAYLAKDNNEEALNYFSKAANQSTNNAIAPVYLMKAGKLALSLKNYKQAESLFETIKTDYTASSEAQNIELYINQAKYAQ